MTPLPSVLFSGLAVERRIHWRFNFNRMFDDCGFSVLRQHGNRFDELESLSPAAPGAKR